MERGRRTRDLEGNRAGPGKPGRSFRGWRAVSRPLTVRKVFTVMLILSDVESWNSSVFLLRFSRWKEQMAVISEQLVASAGSDCYSSAQAAASPHIRATSSRNHGNTASTHRLICVPGCPQKDPFGPPLSSSPWFCSGWTDSHRGYEPLATVAQPDQPAPRTGFTSADQHPS